MKRALLSVVLVLAFAAGCAAPTAPTVPSAPPPAAATATTAAPAASAAPIVIGVPTDLGTIEGKDSLNAVKMAVDEINAKGGVDVKGTKRLFQVESIDTREADPGIPVNDAVQAVEKLVLEKKLNAIVVGAFRSEVLPASMDLLTKYKIPYLTTIGMSPVLQQNVAKDYEKYKYFFRVGLNSTYLVTYLTQTMDFLGKNYNFKKAYLVHQDVAWASGTAGGVEKWFKDNGWTVLGKDAYPTGASEFSSTLSKAKDGKADVIVPIFDMPQSGVLLKQSRAMQVTSLLAGFISPVAPASAAQAFGSDVEGMVNLIFEIGPLAVKAVPASVQFNDNYAKKYGEDARIKLSGHGPGPSYDSVYVLKAAIERAGTLDGDALVKALEATDMDGVIGHIKFTKDHQAEYGLDPKTTAIAGAFQWRKGARIPVFPDVAAESKIELPSTK